MTYKKRAIQGAFRQVPFRQVVVQGEYIISSDENCVFTTVLGSCIACCLYDPVNRIGGMNHFLLPGEGENISRSHGQSLMVGLISDLIKQGAARKYLQAKLFGGAYIQEGLPEIGEANIIFAKKFLRGANIKCVEISLGGQLTRRLKFSPTTGKINCKFISNDYVDYILPKKALFSGIALK
ncbi:MAG: chemotaxis protein CheD [Robiginitomaculum sp.]|nr:MAG: chemotaxis protein CheD [Robiginitomaculum sp.]